MIAPSLIPKKSGQRIKTDRRDAVKLAQNHRAGELVAVFIPDEKTEAIRDLERAREDAKKAERVVRHQLSKFLLRNGRRYPGKTTWNDAHRAWIAKQTFAEPAQQYVLSRRTGGRRGGHAAVPAVDRAAAGADRGLAAGALGQGVASDAWGRIRDGRDPGGGGGGLPAVRQGDRFHGLRRADSLGADQREPPPSGPDHQDGQRPCASRAGRIGVALSAAAADEQGVARAERGDLAAGLCDRVEGTEAAAQPAPSVDRPGEEPRRGGDGGGA